MKNVTVALLAGPMYDALYEQILPDARAAGLGLQIGFCGDHPTLNAHLAGSGHLPYDLISTHTKYAPSQAHFLAPLDNLIPSEFLADFAPRTLELARVNGRLLSVPRNIDVRLLHYRTDLMSAPPRTWDELLSVARRLNAPPDFSGFVFPGMESGLFGTLYELAEMAGAKLFPPSGVPDIQNAGGQWALQLMRTMVEEGLVPDALPHFHYDQVHATFRDGRCAMVGDWPGFYALYCDPAVSCVSRHFAVCPYPIGPTGESLAYGGSHTFALTPRGAANPAAIELLQILTSSQNQLFEARRGSVPVRRSVMSQMQSESAPSDLARWNALAEVIEHHVLIPPKLACYPSIEEVIWKTVQSAIVGQLPIPEALGRITTQIQHILETQHGQ